MTVRSPDAGRATRRIALALVLLLAIALRFYHLDWAEYKLDEANISRLALNMVRYGKVPIWGLGSSVGIYNGALSEWLLAIPYAISSSPLVATGFVAALNVLAVAMTYALTRRIAGPLAGLIAALLFAVAPWAVLNSRKLWAQDLLPPFVIAYLWTAYLAFVKHKPWWLIGHVLALSACIQLHYSALTMVFLTAFFILIFWWRKWPWKILSVSTLVGLLAFGPFLYLDATTLAKDPMTGQMHAFPNVTLILQTVLYRKAVVDATALQMAWIMVTGSDLHSLAGPTEFRHFLNSTWPVTPLLVVFGLLTIVALAWSLWRAVRSWSDAQAQAGLIVAMGVIFPIILFVWHSTPVFPHYFILLYPWPYVLVGMFIAWWANQYPRWRAAWWAGALVVVIAAAQVYAYLSILHFVAGRATPEGYGTPVRLLLNVVDAAAQRSRELGDAEILVLGGSDDVYADSEASTFDVLLDPRVPHRIVNATSARVYPAGKAVLIERVLPTSSEVAQFSLRPGEVGYRLTDWHGLNPQELDQLLGGLNIKRLAAPARFASGVELLGYRTSGGTPGQTLDLVTAWRVQSAPPAGVDYHWTNQLFDAEGQRVWQKDDVGLPASNWRGGDVVHTEFSAPLPAEVKPGTYQMRVGMYTYPDIKTVPLVDGAGYLGLGAIEIK